VNIYDKKTGAKIDSIDQSVITYGQEFQDFQKARSFITGENKHRKVVDNDYGDFIIADFNFDGKDDMALVNDLGGNGGRFYSYYIQQKDNKYLLDPFLTDSMIYFPKKIIKPQKELITYVHAGACGLGKHRYKLTTKWTILSHQTINICK
jgi:hypothetical protein